MTGILYNQLFEGTFYSFLETRNGKKNKIGNKLVTIHFCYEHPYDWSNASWFNILPLGGSNRFNQ